MKSNCRSRLLLDVGGTFIKCSDGRQIPIDSDGSFESISRSLSSSVSDFCRDDTEKGKSIAVAIPGPFDYNEGRFLMTHKFASVYGRLFRDIAGIPDSTELLFCHDVVAMLKGEMIGGYGAGFDRVALITLGTGLGCAVSIDGEILLKPQGSPSTSIYARPYADGILEDYVSKRGIMAEYASRGRNARTVKEIADRAKAGEKEASGAFLTAGARLAESIAQMLREYSIECLLFGGQISRSFSLMEPALSGGLKGCSLKRLSAISDIDNATFRGLETL